MRTLGVRASFEPVNLRRLTKHAWKRFRLAPEPQSLSPQALCPKSLNPKTLQRFGIQCPMRPSQATSRGGSGSCQKIEVTTLRVFGVSGARLGVGFGVYGGLGFEFRV